MNRTEKVLHQINPNGYGLEIGPSYNPIAPKKEGYKVDIIDHLNREDLIAKYKVHPVNVENIEEVDFVWHGESYSELTGKNKHYDWIIASHVIEHTPDLIGFLNDCDTILKDDGVISLAIPDKRYCFDHYRPISGISKIIDNHLQKKKTSTPGTVLEHLLNLVLKTGHICWNSSITGDFSFGHSLEEALHVMNVALSETEYVDAHAWCFVPHSFRLMIHDLFCLGFISFQEVNFFPTEGCEFYVTISRNGQGIGKSRLEMLEIIEAEIKEEMADAKSRLASLKADLNQRDSRMTNLERIITEQQQHSAELQAQLQSAQNQIETMSRTRGWRALQTWWRLKSRFMPKA